jgi:hypothetical protein
MQLADDMHISMYLEDADGYLVAASNPEAVVDNSGNRNKPGVCGDSKIEDAHKFLEHYK